jgi:hypothetical protein
MTGFAFAADDSTDAENDAEDAVTVPYEENETGDLYLSSVNWEQVTFAIMKSEGYEALKVQSEDTLADWGRLNEKYEDRHPTQRLHLLAVLFKSEAGKRQGEMNDHSAGLTDSKAPESHDEVAGDRTSYALYASDLEAIDWSGLTDEETEMLEEGDIDADRLGFDTTFDGPKLLKVFGERLPIAVEEVGDMQKAVDILQDLPAEPSYYDEDDGLVESSDTSVFTGSSEPDTTESVEDDSDDEATEDNDSKYPDFNLAENPERVNEVQVKALRGHNGSPERLHVSNIDSRRTMQTMCNAEADADNTRKGAMKRLKERRSALQGDDDEETEETEETDADDDTDEELNADKLAQQFGFGDIEKQAMQYRVENDDAEDLEEAAKQVADI